MHIRHLPGEDLKTRLNVTKNSRLPTLMVSIRHKENWKSVTLTTRSKNSDAAVPCLNEFLSLHPTHPHIDYAYYLKGLASLPIRSPKFGERYFKTQEQFSDHDAEAARDAYAAFTEVVNRFPLSGYADSARQILVDLINTFARHDLRIARFHLYREAYVGGINRANQVLERYETSPHTEEALAILVYAYEKLDLPDLAAE